MVVGGLRRTLVALAPEKRPGWASGSVWTGAENLAPSRIRSPNTLKMSLSVDLIKVLFLKMKTEYMLL